eukprot:scaffold248444_cov71-Cyclotella_meneghiniana.AAC.5
MAMDQSTIWPYFPRFLIARPQFLRFWRACTAFIQKDIYGIIKQSSTMLQYLSRRPSNKQREDKEHRSFVVLCQSRQ